MLFAFPDAFALNQRWLERHPDDLNVLSDFAEKHFTTGRFAACAERLTTLLALPDVQPGVAAALRVLTIPTLLALQQPAQVPAAIDALLAHVTAQTDDFRVTWSFEGVKHFIGQHGGLAPYRPWLQQFFNAVQAERHEALVTGLKPPGRRSQARISGQIAGVRWLTSDIQDGIHLPAIGYRLLLSEVYATVQLEGAHNRGWRRSRDE